MRRLPTREVHLDFHTSEHINGIGSKFDKKQFQDALIEGRVNSITVFGKCHHGYHYFPTKVGTVHPGMEQNFDLSGAMMDACHEIGVYAPLYLTLGWSALDAEQHPEWIVRKKDGSYSGVHYDFNASKNDPRPENSWVNLCSAGGYRDYLYAMTREACDRYQHLDGLFFDIVFVYDVCYCDNCKKGMKAMGFDPDNESDAKKYFEIQKKKTLDGLREILFEKHPDATLFFNSGGAEIHMPQWHYASTHFEMEDLPTACGGYDKMPMRARYFAGSGKDYLGMTGKFHRSWGEFGGFKTPEALRYECAALLANGARISVGDQMHPYGKMDMETYKNIGKAFSYVEQIEEFCFDTTETAKLGVMVSKNEKDNEAMAKILADCQIDFDVIHNEEDIKRFDTVIIPDGYRLSDSMGAAFGDYAAAGGKLLILGGGALKETADEFAFDIPFVYKGKSDYEIDYLELTAKTDEDIVTSPILCYTSAHKVEGCGQVLAAVREPLFNRTYAQYCSHCNTPYGDETAEYPAAIQNGNIIYTAHELTKMYLDYGVTYHRRYFKWLLRRLYNADNVKVDLPSQGRLHLVKRESYDQYVLHLMYASPVMRGDVSILEDFPVLYNTKVELCVPETITTALMMPQNVELPVTHKDGSCFITVPEFAAHQMIVFKY